MSKHTLELRSRCCVATMTEGPMLAGCDHNWICDKCGKMCTGIVLNAAPDMLEALELIVRLIPEGDEKGSRKDTLDHHESCCLAHAKKAIAKAKGVTA